MLGIRNQRRVNQPLVIGRVGEEGLLVMQMGKKGILYNVLYHLSNIYLVRGGDYSLNANGKKGIILIDSSKIMNEKYTYHINISISQ